MKKLFCTLFLMLVFCFSVHATNVKDTPINVKITNITSNPNGYYCLHVFVGYDAEKGCHIPTRIGFGWINRYLIGITKEENGYLQFAYSSPQTKLKIKQATNWLCKIPLNKSGNITVIVNATNCTYTYR